MDIAPLIGTYGNVVNKVSVKQHVEWSTHFGIGTWITSWWGPASYQSNAIISVYRLRSIGIQAVADFRPLNPSGRGSPPSVGIFIPSP